MRPLNDQSLRQLVFREILLGIKSELLSNLRPSLAKSRSAERDPFDGLAVCRLDAIQLAAIEAALERIDRGDYGRCADCGQALSNPRLAAIPWVARCIGCQERSSSCGAAEDRAGRDRSE